MIIMKRLLSIALILGIVLSFSIPAFTFVGLTFTVDDKIAHPGEEFTIPIRITGNPGVFAVSMSVALGDGLELNYDPQNYTTNSSTWPYVNGDILPVSRPTGGAISPSHISFQFIDIMSEEDVADDGILVNLKLKLGETAAAGEYSIGISVTVCYNISENDVPFQVEAGTVTVLAPPLITTTELPAGTFDTEYSYSLNATGGSIKWSVDEGSLPSGLNLATDTGLISGTPNGNGIGSYTFVIRASNGFDSSDTKTFSITILKAAQSAPPAPTMASKSATSITLDPITGAEYRLGAQGAWQDDTTFGKLDPDTGYTFFARMKETTTHEMSPVSLESDTFITESLPSYSISVGPLKNGTVTPDKGEAHYGDSITLTVTPDEGYRLVAGSLKYNGTTLAGNGFTMPAADVTITAEFESIMDKDENTVGKDENTAPNNFPSPPEEQEKEDVDDGNTPLAWLNPYTDVAPTDWFYDAVRVMTGQGLMDGTTSDTFSPRRIATRALLMETLYRIEGCPDTEGNMPFSDVSNSDWYYKAVLWASDNGIALGYPDGSFRPDGLVTREQTFTILYRYAELKGLDISASADLSMYTDKMKISGWALNAIEWAVAVGIVKGRTANTIVPKEEISRAEIAELFRGYIGNDTI